MFGSLTSYVWVLMLLMIGNSLKFMFETPLINDLYFNFHKTLWYYSILISSGLQGHVSFVHHTALVIFSLPSVRLSQLQKNFFLKPLSQFGRIFWRSPSSKIANDILSFTKNRKGVLYLKNLPFKTTLPIATSLTWKGSNIVHYQNYVRYPF